VFHCQEANMKIRSSLPRLLLSLSLILCAAAVHADAGRPLKLILDPGAGATDRALAAWQGAGYGPRIGNAAWMILAGVAGNLAGLYAGGFLVGGEVNTVGPALGALAGSACGSALGVYFAGGGGRRGSFGAALGGSLMGEVAALALALAIRNGDGPFLTGFLILPPIGAALVFNSSQRSWSARAGNGILNLAGGKLGLGVPDIQVRPSYIPGLKAKAELQFNVRVLSVEM
jgi:hypothetical protein